MAGAQRVTRDQGLMSAGAAARSDTPATGDGEAVAGGRLLVIRHGRTRWERSRFKGRADVPLDDVGLAQAQTIATLLRDDGVTKIFSSPLRRALDTARTLGSGIGSPVFVHSGLVELDCGNWEGTPKQPAGRAISQLEPAQRLPGGESLLDAWARLTEFRVEIGLDELVGTVAVVGHRVTNQLLVAMLLREPVATALRDPIYRPAAGSVLELRRDGRNWRLQAFRLTGLLARL